MASREIDPQHHKFWLSVEFLKVYVQKEKLESANIWQRLDVTNQFAVWWLLQQEDSSFFNDPTDPESWLLLESNAHHKKQFIGTMLRLRMGYVVKQLQLTLCICMKSKWKVSTRFLHCHLNMSRRSTGKETSCWWEFSQTGAQVSWRWGQW